MSVVLSLLVILLLPCMVFADDKEYSVEYAEFIADIQENGDAIITEKWTVDFKKGDFTRFYKDIYKMTTELEQFDDIEVIGATINGKDAEATWSIDRVDYHYFFEKNQSSDTDTIHWFLHAKNETVRYEIQYVLKGVVKETDDDMALFCYRFIGKNFPVTVKTTSTTIIAPNNSPIDVRYSATNDYYTGRNGITFNTGAVKGMLKYNVCMDSRAFYGLKYVPLDTIKKNEKKDPLTEDDIFGFIAKGCLGTLFGGIVLLISKAIYNSRRIKRMYKNNPDFLNEIVEKYERYNISTLLLAKISKVSIEAHWTVLFDIALLDMVRRGKAEICSDYFAIHQGVGVPDRYDLVFENILKHHIELCSMDGKEVFRFDALTAVLQDSKRRTAFEHEIRNMYRNYYAEELRSERVKQVIDYLGKKNIKKDMMLFKHAVKYLNIHMDGGSCFSYADRNKTITYYIIAQYIFGYKKNAELNAEEYGYDSYFYYVDNTIYYSSSGSGCSSCSSCSSCSGCGGGGAD